ncbi:hypothetical protein [Micromonospora sp. NPDC004551]|uniref:lipopolysaccharide biosynthesis protein n=1 Tax=Micromonospora sp. NPDC004551 TaxID=3154284 RepID=UPI0033A162D9
MTTTGRQVDVPRASTETRPSSPTGPARWSALRTTGLLLAPQLAAAIASVIINVLAARTLGPAGRGHIALLLQLGYLANMLSIAGIDRAYPVLIPPGRGPYLAVRDTTRLVAPIGAIILAVSVPVVAVIGADTASGPWLTAAAFVIAAVALMSGGAVRTAAAASDLAGPYLVGALAGQSLLVAAAGMLSVLRVDSPGLWLLAYGATLGVSPLAAWALLRRRHRTERVGGAEHLRKARSLGLRLLPAGLASMIMLRADRLLLPWLGSYEQLGLYIVVATVAELAVWPVQSWVDVQASRWHRQHLAGTLRRARPIVVVAGYGLGAGILLVAAGRVLVPLIFGDGYRDSILLLIPLAIGTLAYSISRVAVGLSVATGRARTALIADIPAMLAALAAYAVLIPERGAYGAAVGSAIAYGIGAALAIVALLTATPSDDRAGRKIVPPARRSATPR